MAARCSRPTPSPAGSSSGRVSPIPVWPCTRGRDRPDESVQQRAHAGSEVERPRAGIGEGPTEFRQVEVLDADAAAVLELAESADDSSKVDDAGGIVGVDLRRAWTALAKLDV